jgi:cytoskeleton protein RodZ
MAEPPLSQFGARLRDARAARGVTLRQIANTTKVSVSALEAIERSDLSRLPGGIFTRSFVRAYASEVGLDPDAAVKEFLAQFPPGSDEGLVATPVSEMRMTIEGESRTPQTLWRLGLVSLPLLATLAYFAWRPDATPPPAATTVLEEPARPSASRAAKPALDQTPATLPAVNRNEGLTITLSTTDECWVGASADGRHVMSRLLAPGEETVLRADREILMRLGNAGGVALTVNGTTGRSLGTPGQVVTVRITSDNYRSFQASN